MWDVIREGLTLPLRIWLQPDGYQAWAYALTQHSAAHAKPGVHVSNWIDGLMVRFLIAFLWIPISALLAYRFDLHVAFEQMQLGLAIGVLMGIAGFVGGGLSNPAMSVARGTGLGVIFGVTVIINVALLRSFAFATGMSIAQVVDRGSANTSPMFGVAIGLILGIVGGLFSRKWTIIVGTLAGIGVLVYFYIGSAPRVQAANVATALYFLVTVNHLFLYPFQFVIALFSGFVLHSDPKTARDLCQFAPIHWDESVCLPLPSTVNLLVAFYQQDSAMGSEAIREIAHHPFQARAALKALARLENPPMD